MKRSFLKGGNSPLRKKSRNKSVRQKLHERAWKLQSIFIRQDGMKENEYNDCYTCGNWYHWTRLEAGHFKHGVRDFDPMNIHRQCARCNKWGSGMSWEYGKRLIKEHGMEAVGQLEARCAIMGNKYTEEELQNIISKYGNN